MKTGFLATRPKNISLINFTTGTTFVKMNRMGILSMNDLLFVILLSFQTSEVDIEMWAEYE